MAFLLISFVAGLLTVLAPCILPLLPVVIGSSASGRSRKTPYIVVISLAISIILFTYLLKVSTAFIMIPPEVWTYLSGGIILLFGITLVFPDLWEKIPLVNRISRGSNKLLGEGYQKKSFWGDVIIGASLGPIFSTCSPTYFVILASVLPASFALGTLYLFSYTLGLSIVLLFIAILGERFSQRLSSLSDPHSKFKRSIGVIFIILGLMISFGYEKKLETAILNSGLDITRLEQKLLQKNEENKEQEETPTDTSEQNAVSKNVSVKEARVATKNAKPYKEIADPAGFVNTGDMPIKIGDYVGKKVILLDVMTYSCINCQRTFPFVTAWYEKYKDQGLIVIGIHTPEFSFEKNKANVEEAMKKFGINFPVVLDNNYGTWNAYGNQFWPRKYLIDIHGNIIYDHIGEGAYEEMEMKIRDALKERTEFLGMNPMPESSLAVSKIKEVEISAQSPETYFGSFRNERFANGTPGVSGEQTFTLPVSFFPNLLYLGGSWNLVPEYAVSISNTSIIYSYNAKEVYIVADSDTEAQVEVWQDGAIVSSSRGEDVNESGILKVKESRLYKIIRNDKAGAHTLELKVKSKGIRFYTFTFG